MGKSVSKDFRSGVAKTLWSDNPRAGMFSHSTAEKDRPEVHQDQPSAIPGEHDVGGSNVAVQTTSIVEVFQGLRQSHEKVGEFPGERTTFPLGKGPEITFRDRALIRDRAVRLRPGLKLSNFSLASQSDRS